MSVSAGSVEIDIIANDQTSDTINNIGGAFQTVRQDINSQNDVLDANTNGWLAQSKQVNLAFREQRFIRREYMLQHQTFSETTRLMTGIGHAGMRLNSIFLGYNAIQIRQQQADERVATAKERLANAVAKYGVHSKQATDAQKDLNKAMADNSSIAQQMPIQYLAMGMQALGFAGDLQKIGLDFKLLKHSIGRQGGLKNVIGGFLGSGSFAPSTIPLDGMLGGMRGSNGKMGGLMRRLGGARGMGMLGIGATGLGLTEAFESGALGSTGSAQGDKLTGLLGSVGSTAMMGAAFGPWGALAGGVAGLGLGLAQNYGEEFSNLFAGKGFKSNKDLGIDINLNVSADDSLNVQSDVMARTMATIHSNI